MNYYSNDRDRLVRIFEDTLSLCRNDEQIRRVNKRVCYLCRE